MDKLDIFELDEDTKIITTIEQIRNVHARGFKEGYWDEEPQDVIIEGEIVG